MILISVLMVILKADSWSIFAIKSRNYQELPFKISGIMVIYAMFLECCGDITEYNQQLASLEGKCYIVSLATDP